MALAKAMLAILVLNFMAVVPSSGQIRIDGLE
jgi:hypothetical protein